MSKKVFVIGAGVIGLLLGKELALNGIDTTIYDSKRKVSDNTAKASGIFSKEGLSRIGVNYHDAVVNSMNGAVIHAGKQNLKIASKETVAYILDRGIFAELCAREAAAAGAKIILDKRIGKEELLDIKKDKTNIIVGADGAVSNVASTFGFPPINEYVLTYKAEYENVAVPDLHSVDLFFSNRISSRFFSWTVPYSKTKLEVGIGVSNRSKKTSSYAFDKFIETPQMTEMLKDAKRTAKYASLIPLEYRSKTVIDNVLLVGDAAGQVKATTGGGIIFGVACAKIAAKAITDNINNGVLLLNYDREWRQKHGLDLKLHKILHTYYSSLNEKSFEMMLNLSKIIGVESFLSAYGDMDRPSLMIKRLFVRRKIEN